MPRKFTTGEAFGAAMTGLVQGYSNYRNQQERDRQFGLQERQVASQETLATAQAGKIGAETTGLGIDNQNKQDFWDANISQIRAETQESGVRSKMGQQELDEAIATQDERTRQLFLKGASMAIDVNLQEDTYDALVMKHRMDAELAEATAKMAQADASNAEEWAKIKIAKQRAENRKLLADEYYTRKAGDYQGALAEHTQFEDRMAQQAVEQQAQFQLNAGMPNVGTGKMEAASPNVLGYLDTRGADNSPVAIRGRLTKQLDAMEFFEMPEVQFALANGKTPAGEPISEAYLQEVVLDTAQAMNTFEKGTLVDMMKAGLFIDALRTGNKDNIKGYLPNGGKGMDHIVNVLNELSEDPNFTLANIPAQVYIDSKAVNPKFHGSGFDPANLVEQVGPHTRDIELDIYAMMRAGMDYTEVVKTIGTAMDYARKDAKAKHEFEMANTFMGPTAPLAGVGTQEQRISQGRALLGGTVGSDQIGPFGVAGTAPAFITGLTAGKDEEGLTSFQREYRAARGPTVNLTSFGSLMRAAGSRAKANTRFPFKAPVSSRRPIDRARP